VAGASGAGKSTFARRVAAALDAPYTELDALHHGTAWVPRPEFIDCVERLSAGRRWTTEWQYPGARRILASRADLLVFLDLPRWLVMARVVRRTLSRRIRHIELWNGNFEPPLRTVIHDRDHIVRWAWRTNHENLGRVSELIERWPDLPGRAPPNSPPGGSMAGGSARPSPGGLIPMWAPGETAIECPRRDLMALSYETRH